MLSLIDMSGMDGVGEFSVIELVDGKADGLRHVVRQGCTGRVLAFLWSAYRDVRRRGEPARPSVYILVGPNDAGLSVPHRTVQWAAGCSSPPPPPVLVRQLDVPVVGLRVGALP